MGTNDFKYNKVPLFARKTGNINTSRYNIVPLFGRKPGNINASMSAAPKLALVPASQYYRDMTWSYHNVCAKFH